MIRCRVEKAPEVRRIEDVQLRHDQRDDADREVDVEHPAPAVVLGDPPAEHRAKDWRDNNAESPEAHRAPALLRLERLEQHGLRERLKRSARRALNDAEDHERRQVRSSSAEKRREREARSRPHEQTLAAELARQPAGHRQNNRVGNQIRRQRPRRFVGRCRQIARDVRQRHVDDGGVQHLHEGGEHHRERDEPGIDLLLCHFSGKRNSKCKMRNAKCKRAVHLHSLLHFAFCILHYLVYTVGTTDIPGRNRCSGSCPSSSRIRTGTRCTTLT